MRDADQGLAEIALGVFQSVLIVVTGECCVVPLYRVEAGFLDRIRDPVSLLDLIEPVLLEDRRVCGNPNRHNGPCQGPKR
ncbi:TPA: hypothetical protein DCE37_15430 [Candidatus Latescibacteria bacterium]|nr:hypothetical protein [Candidatus Latescibacterota bacterium]